MGHAAWMTFGHFTNSPSPALPRTAYVALDRVSSMVAIARSLAASGRAVDLNGLEATAGLLCAQVLDLPPAESVVFRPVLMELSGQLSALSAALSAGSAPR